MSIMDSAARRVVVALCWLIIGAQAHAASTQQCRGGLVWREAYPGDVVCVTPAMRDRIVNENDAAPTHVAYCKPGLVQRRAVRGDKVCVSVQARTTAANENNLSLSRSDLTCARVQLDPAACVRRCLPGFEQRLATSTDHVCAPSSAHDRVLAENALAQQNRNNGPACETGFVWRLARGDDLVCVTPQSRAENQAANAAAASNIEPRVAMCKDYANSAVTQSSEYFARACGPASDRWQTNWQNHFDFCMGPQGNIINKEASARAGLLSQCRTSSPIHAATGNPNTQGACNVSVILHNADCRNQYGIPSDYFEPGTHTAVGCGSDEAHAILGAKASVATSIIFVEAPANGACTYTKQTVPGCLCR